jgi:glycosyltransferase involved in cell wall biosynthesis
MSGGPGSEQPLVSVVTPVYNGADLLEECIESVLRQTYANWTYTIVDNASTDTTADIAERFVRKDSRISHRRFEEFVGAVDNANRAYGCVDPGSAWCKPLLADDWLYPECLERMVAVAARSDTIAIVSAYQRWGDRVHLVALPYDEEVFEGRTVLGRLLEGAPNVLGNPTSVLVRTDRVLAREAFYEKTLEHGTDTDAFFRTLLEGDLGFVHQVLTYARRQGNTRYERGQRIGTSYAEQLIFLVRYGRSVLDDARYRTTLRRFLGSYVRYHLKQAVRPSRLVDEEFLSFHLDAAATLLREGAGDAEFVRSVRFVRTLLRRGALARLVRRPGGAEQERGVTRRQRRRLLNPP